MSTRGLAVGSALAGVGVVALGIVAQFAFFALDGVVGSWQSYRIVNNVILGAQVLVALAAVALGIVPVRTSGRPQILATIGITLAAAFGVTTLANFVFTALHALLSSV